MLAFEASGEHYAQATKALADIPNLDIRQQALVGPDRHEPTIRPYEGGIRGKADSLFVERGTSYEDVPAV